MARQLEVDAAFLLDELSEGLINLVRKKKRKLNSSVLLCFFLRVTRNLSSSGHDT